MTYFVKLTTNNGYRCSCCHKSWTKLTQVDDRVEALAAVPRKYVHDDQIFAAECIEVVETECVEVVDGVTGKVIAVGHLNWIDKRPYRYSHYHWHGHREGKPFDDVHGLLDGESTWSDLVERVDHESNKKRIAQLQAEADQKLKEITELKKKL